jgi:hypothetical protein
MSVREITAFDIKRVANQFYEYNFHSSSSLNHIERKRDETAVVECFDLMKSMGRAISESVLPALYYRSHFCM